MSRQGKPERKQSVVNLTLAVVAGQVGFLTLAIVLGAVLGGLWLDNHFGTRPIITLLLVVISIPVSVLVMLAVVRSAVARIKAQAGQNNHEHHEEEDIGRNQSS